MQTATAHRQLLLRCIAIGSLLTGLLLGCATPSKENPATADQMEPPPGTEAPAAQSPAQAAAAKPQDSLWQQGNDFGTLFVSQKALRVGDIVTVKIVESSSAVNEATTTTGRDSSIGIKTEKFFGLEDETTDWMFNPFGELSANFESDFEGDGKTERSGDLTAYITANVTEVLPNGNLRILGNREVTINNEKQFLYLSGVIRTKDISQQNEILSTYIADAQIEYSGKGVVNDRQRPGWLSSLLNKVWPF